MVVYVNVKEKRVISEIEYQCLLSQEIDLADSFNFYEWLKQNYRYEDLWSLTDQEKIFIRQDFINFVRGTCEEYLAKEWVKMEYDSKTPLR